MAAATLRWFNEIPGVYLSGGSRLYMCLFDFQKAFDSVYYPTLMKKLYDVGTISKFWILLTQGIVHAWILPSDGEWKAH